MLKICIRLCSAYTLGLSRGRLSDASFKGLQLVLQETIFGNSVPPEV